jgi:hypothetical protein
MNLQQQIARRWRVPTRLNLDELNELLGHVHPGRRPSRDLASACTRLECTRDRRRRAVARAKR